MQPFNPSDIFRQAFPGGLEPQAEALVMAAWEWALREQETGPAPWARIDRIQAYNTARVLRAFHEVRASEGFLYGTTGYGYGDPGRDALEQLFARVFGGQRALVRPQLVSGTHALACALFGNLRPGDELVVATGPPYDTLWPVLGIGPTPAPPQSLTSLGVRVRVVARTRQGHIDWDGVDAALSSRTRMVLVQRSRGYSWQPSVDVETIGKLAERVHRRVADALVLVDNAYGEFVEPLEPGMVGADLVVGSLIKNPGGGLAPSGGYVVGQAEAVEQAAARLTAPGLAAEVGPSLGVARALWMGLFLAPHVAGEALAGAVVAAAAFERFGLPVAPRPEASRTDTVQAVRAGTARRALAIVQGIQAASALDASAVVRPARLPGYADPIAMAGGTFIQGSSSELSADLPMRPPYDVFLQGGLSRHHVVLGVARALHALLRADVAGTGDS